MAPPRRGDLRAHSRACRRRPGPGADPWPALSGGAEPGPAHGLRGRLSPDRLRVFRPEPGRLSHAAAGWRGRALLALASCGKRLNLLRCAESPRSHVLPGYACARLFFARLASEIFLSSLQAEPAGRRL